MAFRQNEPEAIYRTLVDQVDTIRVRRILIGLNWTVVATDAGCGLAQTPPRDSLGCKAVNGAGNLQENSLADLAALTFSHNPTEAAIGVAAINAYFNRYDLEGTDENGLDAFADIDGPVTVLGRFPGLDKRLSDPRIVEREPRDGEYPESAAPKLIAQSAAVIITASTMTNHSLPSVLRHCKGKRVALVGPGTPLAPILHSYGIEVLAGTIIEDLDGALAAVSQGGAVQALKPNCRFVSLRGATGKAP